MSKKQSLNIFINTTPKQTSLRETLMIYANSPLINHYVSGDQFEEMNTMDYFYKQDSKLILSVSDLSSSIMKVYGKELLEYYDQLNIKNDDSFKLFDYFWHNKQIKLIDYQFMMGMVSKIYHTSEEIQCVYCSIRH
jgi:hypothetical protein